jgi:hypothetical protein
LKTFVVDTVVLKIAELPSDSRCLEALEFLFIILRAHRIGLDGSNGEIFEEYCANLNKDGVVFKLIIKLIRRENKVVFGRRHLPADVTRILEEPPGFDPNDRKFVEVAYATKGNIVTEDVGPGDFDDRVRSVLKDKLSMHISRIQEANIELASVS